MSLMLDLSLEEKMLAEFHERQLKTLEQGINDIEACVKRNKLFILFLYENEIIYGSITFMNDKYLVVKGKCYYYDKMENIYSYFTLQKIPLTLLTEWYNTYDDEFY